MDKLEKVEKIREKTGVTYEEAKNALEACNFDVLDAIVYLEALGRIEGPRQTSYTTGAERTAQDILTKPYPEQERESNFGSTMDRFFDWFKGVLKKSLEIKFIVKKEGRELFSVPVLVLVIGLLFGFWITIPLLVVGLFLNCRYSFDGVDTVSVNLNDVMNKAGNMAEEIKNNVNEKKNEKKDEEK